MFIDNEVFLCLCSDISDRLNHMDSLDLLMLSFTVDDGIFTSLHDFTLLNFFSEIAPKFVDTIFCRLLRFSF